MAKFSHKDSGLTEMVRPPKRVRFIHYRDSELWYETECGFEFPVPISEAGTATFHAEDKAILFMRYIRKQMLQLEEWKQEAKSPPSS